VEYVSVLLRTAPSFWACAISFTVKGYFAAIGKHHVHLFLVIISALCTYSMYGVKALAPFECHTISLAIIDRTKDQARDGTSSSIMGAFDVHFFVTILLK
jgi:hypothetical protein